MATTHNQMKENLRIARRSFRADINDTTRSDIKRAVTMGLSKKALTIIYGLEYSDIKLICQG